jgi:DNA-binding CsgD family transcriptional regulator
MEPPKALSKREQEVVDRLLEGESNKLIAASLGITERTVEFHLKNIYDKYRVQSRVELVLKLRSSTVAAPPPVGDNGAQPSAPHWATSLRTTVALIGKEIKMTSLAQSHTRPAGNNPTFFEAIRTCLTKYADFSGRASRPEFWWFALFVTLVSAALAYFSSNVASVFLLAMALPFLAAGARRLHDTGRSGWWQLFLLAPVAGIVVAATVWALPPVAPQPDDTPPA